MNKFASISSKSLKSHQSCKSYIDSHKMQQLDEELFNYSGSSNKNEKKSLYSVADIYKTQDSRDPQYKDPREGSDAIRRKSKSEIDDRFRDQKAYGKHTEKVCSKSELIKEQDSIIRMQCSLIEDLKEKGRKLKKNIFLHENTVEELKNQLDKERQEREKIEEEIKRSKENEENLVEENNILAQNYEKLQKRCEELEAKVSVYDGNMSKGRGNGLSTENIIEKYDEMHQENTMLNDKYKELSEKIISSELENKFLKLQVNKLNEKIEEIMVKNPKKAEMKELRTKLRSSEKARYHYQEQTIELKEKVNNLENQLKLESSIKYSISPGISPMAFKKISKNKSSKELKQLLKSNN